MPNAVRPCKDGCHSHHCHCHHGALAHPVDLANTLWVAPRAAESGMKGRRRIWRLHDGGPGGDVSAVANLRCSDHPHAEPSQYGLQYRACSCAWMPAAPRTQCMVCITDVMQANSCSASLAVRHHGVATRTGLVTTRARVGTERKMMQQWPRPTSASSNWQPRAQPKNACFGLLHWIPGA